MPVKFWPVGKAKPQSWFALHISHEAICSAAVISEIPRNPGPHVENYLDTISEKLVKLFSQPLSDITLFLQDASTGVVKEIRRDTKGWKGVITDREEVEKIMGESIEVPAFNPKIEYEL